jgi:hypothetical protein
MSSYVALQSSGDFLAWLPADITVSSPIAKSGSDGETKLLAPISGVASSEAADADEDEIDQTGLDWSFCLNKGIFTYEHPVDISRLAGYPEKVEQVRLSSGKLATRVSGQLYLNRPFGKLVYDTQKAMAEAGGRRTLGFSIEGRVLPGGRKGKRVTKAQVMSIAISPVPKNPDTWMDIAASMFARGHSRSTVNAVMAAVDADPTLLNKDQVTNRLVREFRHLTWEQAEKLADVIMAG